MPLLPFGRGGCLGSEDFEHFLHEGVADNVGAFEPDDGGAGQFLEPFGGIGENSGSRSVWAGSPVITMVECQPRRVSSILICV